ncbi:MAG: sigma-70 family RNA polymerase sigma factor [Aureliella sp.]
MSSVPIGSTPRGNRSVNELIERVRQGGADSLGELLNLYRGYLNVLAKPQVNGRLARRVDASDIVQDTMLAAHRDFESFRGRSEAELVAWLRQILAHAVSHAVERHIRAQKRDVRREVPLNSLPANHSSAGLADFLADQGVSPSDEIGNRELSNHLTEQLAKLKPDYRQIIIYRNLQGLSFEEIAEKMDRKAGALRMLWLRAIAKFKDTCAPLE